MYVHTEFRYGIRVDTFPNSTHTCMLARSLHTYVRACMYVCNTYTCTVRGIKNLNGEHINVMKSARQSSGLIMCSDTQLRYPPGQMVQIVFPLFSTITLSS